MSVKKLIAAALLTMSMGAQAGVVVGGSTLINPAGETQLELWLGQGPLTLTNIFTKHTGSTSFDFHAAADGKGATFVLMKASEDGINWKTIGGYDPLSWSSAGGWNTTNSSNLYNAFIFNLTDGVKRQQTNTYQTYDQSYFGPTFGGGHDIYVANNLSTGYSYSYSYAGSSGNGRSLVDGSVYNGANMQIGALEVFTVNKFTAQAVPEPASLLLLGMGLAGVVASRRKKAVKA